MTSFTSRYGEPTSDFGGAVVRAHRRHGATVVTVSGRVDARNAARVSAYVTRFVLPDTPFVLDLGGVTAFTPKASALLDATAQRCAATGVGWALVPGAAVARRLRGRADLAALPLIETVLEAEHEFDDAVLKRRRMLLPLLRKTA
ncbi:MAG: STAS domain-containing protein [Mycobacterium sp.]